MIDPDQIPGKAVMFTEWEDRLTIFDLLILCRFYRDLYQWEDLAAMIKGVTGLDLEKPDMRSIAAQSPEYEALQCQGGHSQIGQTSQTLLQ